jgi:structural maintenance of chromosomes protein 6
MSKRRLASDDEDEISLAEPKRARVSPSDDNEDDIDLAGIRPSSEDSDDNGNDAKPPILKRRNPSGKNSSRAAHTGLKAAEAREDDGDDDSKENDDGSDTDQDLSPDAEDEMEESEGELDEMTDAAKMAYRSRGHAFSGVLQSVRLDNFMSHECFEYKLGPNVNIVNGPNGSGKSAIVAAVQIALGAKATATERAPRISEHIMHNKNTAVIKVVIRNKRDPCELEDMAVVQASNGKAKSNSKTKSGSINEDEDEEYVLEENDNGDERAAISNDDSSTYKWDIYGDSITIERTLNRNGPSKVEVKGYRDKRVLSHPALKKTTAAKEVAAICDHFGFMVSNPVAVLTQTKAKAFLAQGKPGQHYALFREATLLGPLTKELLTTEATLKNIETIIRTRMRAGEAVQNQLSDLKAAYESSKEMKTLGRRIRERESIHAWVIATEEEAQLHSMETRARDDFEEKLRKAEKKHETLTDDLDAKAAEMASAATDIEADQVNSNAARALRKETATTYAVRKREMDRKTNDAEALGREADEKNSAHEGVIAQREQAQLSHLAGQQDKERLIHNLQEVNNSIAEMGQKVKDSEAGVVRANEEQRIVNDSLSDFKKTADHLRRDFETKRTEAANQRRFLGDANSVGRFGSHMPAIVSKLDEYVRAGRFHNTPIGPIGQFVSVKEDVWAPTVEDVVGGLLKTFLVCGAHDKVLLEQVFREVKAVGTARITMLGQHSWTRARYHLDPRDLPQVHQHGHCTVMDMLDVKDDAVFNVLIDHCSIERTVLVRGEKAMVEFSRQNRSDRSIGMCWDEHGSRAYSRNNAHTIRAPEKKGNGQRTSVLTSDRSAFVVQLDDAVAALNNDRIMAEQDVAKCQQHYAQLSRNVKTAVDDVRRAIQQHRNFLRAKDEFEEQMRAASSEFDSSAFDEAIASYEAEAKDLVRQQRSMKESAAELIAIVANSKQAEAEALTAFKQVQAAVNAKSNRLASLTDEVAKSRAALRDTVPVVNKLKKLVNRAHVEIDSQRAVFAKVLEDARNLLADRPAELDDPNQVKSEKMQQDIDAMKRRLRMEEQRRDGKTAEDIEIEYLDAKKKDKDNKALLKKVKIYAASISHGLVERKKERKGIEHRVKKLVRNNFDAFLQTRGHRGRIKFSRNPKSNKPELLISTQMGTHKTGDGELYVTDDLRSLSGGERSYTTLAFMLALAEVCQNPVRIMDELDVFMDEAARNAAFQTLVEYCTTQLADRQLVIVTPLALPAGVTASPSVQIVKLSAVKRPHLQTGTQQRIDQFVH